MSLGERRLPTDDRHKQGCQCEEDNGLAQGERVNLTLDLLHLSYHLGNKDVLNPMEKGERIQMGADQWC